MTNSIRFSFSLGSDFAKIAQLWGPARVQRSESRGKRRRSGRSELSAFCRKRGIWSLCRREGIGDFPNKPGRQNDRFPISGKRSLFAFGGHMPSLPGLASNDSECRDKPCLSAFAQQTTARGAIQLSAHRNLPPANRIRSECRTSTARPYVQNNDLILQRHHIIVPTPPQD